MRKIFRRLYSMLFLLAILTLVVFLVLALLEPIVTTPWREWIPLLVFCLISGIAWTIFALRSGKVERTTSEILGTLMVNLLVVILIAFISIIVMSIFAWNGGAPLDDIEPVHPADAQYP